MQYQFSILLELTVTKEEGPLGLIFVHRFITKAIVNQPSDIITSHIPFDTDSPQ